MNQVSKEQLTRIRGRYLEKYGKLMDNWSPMLFYEIQENFTQLDNTVKASIEQINKAAADIKGSHKSFHFKDDRQSLFFGLGIAGPTALAVMLVSILIFWYARSSQDYEQKKQIIDTYENASDYVLLMQHGEIVQHDGAKYLLLRPVPKKGDIFIGKEYIYDPTNKRILVPLGRK
ncbi:hypothetical protein L0657_23465 [Dyadobacter sp. CY345]|uniref:hypothetical protein n=1 Tax=Dyadobacter sp. CY345 TaxID=2909335 RepID=UPI001F3599D4|nr:hypothetical protein [Dyadobacter sp. CY345]MCF2446933.1 hypothetical protein [Dyadobacter sp. CY345]